MRKLLTMIMISALLTTSVFAENQTAQVSEKTIAQTAVELEKVKLMNGVEFELYMLEQANLLDRLGYDEEAAKLRLFADSDIKSDFEQIIEQNLNESASNGLLIGVAIAGCSSVVLCPILIFLAICTMSDLDAASEI